MLNLIKHAEDGNGQTVDPMLLSPEPFRIRVLQNVGETRLCNWWYAAVTHEDVEPRKVMVKEWHDACFSIRKQNLKQFSVLL
jgi:hypothetical protein